MSTFSCDSIRKMYSCCGEFLQPYIRPQAELPILHILSDWKTKPNLIQHTIWWLYIIMHSKDSRDLGSKWTECFGQHPYNQSMAMQRGYIIWLMDIHNPLFCSEKLLEKRMNDLWVQWNGMDQTLWKLPFSAAFWVPTWVCSGERIGSYQGFENMEVRWNGWLILMVIKVPASFRRGLDPKLVIKTAVA